ncbi:hypothetical protein Sjap_011156 [Stephania japonica]|uniref:TBC1 domain family member 15 n=1 Tax=Stephania japonica TaxID=461633 RepID=A0AAP0JB38_9MAGN
MHETDILDLSDDADYAASQQQGSRSISRCSSDRRSEPSGAEVVFVKDNVAIHPTQYASERIRGRLRLIKQGTCLFMTWIPYKEIGSGGGAFGHSDARLSDKDRNLYSIRAVPVTDIRSIRRHTPTLGWQYVIVVLSSGLAFPPLYFYNGGVREFLATLKQHAVLVRSADDANLFLLNDFQDPLQRSLSSLELPRAVSVAPTSTSESSSSSSVSSNRLEDGRSYSEYQKHRQKSNDPARDLSIQVLEKFSLVTKFARETTSHIFGEIHNDNLITNDRKNQAPIVLNSNNDVDNSGLESASTESSVAADPIESLSFSKQKSSCRKENCCEEASTTVGSFELVDCKEFDKMTLVWGKPRQPPLGTEEWATFLDAEGRILDSNDLRKRIFYGGVEHQLRKELISIIYLLWLQIWKILLGCHDYDSTYAEREYLSSIKKVEYEALKRQWQSISVAQAKKFTKFRERKALIDKDVVRTDRSVTFYDGDDNPNVMLLRDVLLTYSFYNFDLGYCQGMSDLLSPILFVMEDESEAFWCFVALMERLGPNFNRDQSGMHSQLFALSMLVELLDKPLHNYFKQKDCLNYFFCFRWVLIQFKREFHYEQTMRMWEVLWTHYLSEHLHLYACVAILKKHRKKIMGEEMDFDTLLKFINDLSGHIDLDATLRDAEALCVCAGENGAALIPPGTPPSLPLESNLLYSQQDEL